MSEFTTGDGSCKPPLPARLGIQLATYGDVRAALGWGDEPALNENKQLIERAWAAGFLDGEGCITISKTQQRDRANPSYRVTVSLCQNHAQSLRRFASAVSVQPRIYPVKRTTSMNRDVYVLQMWDHHAVQVLRTLLPILGRKRPEAIVAVEAYELGRFDVHPGPKGHPAEIWQLRERYYQKLRRMK